MAGDPAASLTVGETAYERLRSDIVFGRLPPGQRLRLEALRSSYGVGIGTLREILSRLSAEGLVVAEGQRGFEVPPLSGRRAARSSPRSGCSSSGTRWRNPSRQATSSGRAGWSPPTTSSRWSRGG